MLMRWLALLMVALAPCAEAQEQPFAIRVFPSTPTTARPVVLTVSWGEATCGAYETFTRAGNVIEIQVASACVLPPFDSMTYKLGLLPAGNYTVRLVDDFIDPGDAPLVQSFDFVVVAVAGAAEVPALEPAMLAMLAAALMTVALLVLRRAV